MTTDLLTNGTNVSAPASAVDGALEVKNLQNLVVKLEAIKQFVITYNLNLMTSNISYVKCGIITYKFNSLKPHFYKTKTMIVILLIVAAGQKYSVFYLVF